MFVSNLKKAAIIGLITPIAVFGATNAATNMDTIEETIPVQVTLSGIQMSSGPLYISVQTRSQYRGIKGHGAVITDVTPGEMTATVSIDKSGEYAVSVWHDLDNDGVFSMTDSYQILDGWGGSGNVPTDRAPTFDDVRVTIGGGGASIPVAIIYPK